MDGGARTVNNPDRVPPILDRIDQPQEGLPRVIHPVGLAVGRPDPSAAQTGVGSMSDVYAPNVPVGDKDITLVNDRGIPFWFPGGHMLTAAEAAQFPDLRDKIDGPVQGAGTARQAAGINERPAVAPGEAPGEERMMPAHLENRSLGPAPENRAIRPPENRDGGYRSQTVPQLRELATARGIEVPADARKDDVVAALESADRGGSE